MTSSNQFQNRLIKEPRTASSNAIANLRSVFGSHSVAVGLSGGVDSSVTASLLIQAGWQVEGVTLWLMSGKGSCCSEGLIDAAGICEQLGISHHVIDARSSFQKEIVEVVVNAYEQGKTPLPCSRCNRFIKFGPMIKWAQENLNFNRIATGHYARVKHFQEAPNLEGLQNTKQRHQLLRGLDPEKDQSYFLYDLSQEILGKVIFPLGELKKADTRKEAKKFNLRTAEKKESQDLCLAEHHGSMKAFLDAYLPPRLGEIVTRDGKVIGKHEGIEHFTIGQRKGLGVAWKEPLHVIELQPSMNRVVVATRAEAGTKKCYVGEINWISIDEPKSPIMVDVQVRYRSKPVQATIVPLKQSNKANIASSSKRCKLIFQEEQFSISPGQAAVFYLGEIVLGGGLIEAR